MAVYELRAPYPGEWPPEPPNTPELNVTQILIIFISINLSLGSAPDSGG